MKSTASKQADRIDHFIQVGISIHKIMFVCPLIVLFSNIDHHSGDPSSRIDGWLKQILKELPKSQSHHPASSPEHIHMVRLPSIRLQGMKNAANDGLLIHNSKAKAAALCYLMRF